jgi:two-component system sensor histidine kinase QseC
MYSIRNRLNITIIASMALVLSFTTVFLYLRIADHVEEVFDSAVLDKAHALISLTEMDGEGLEFDFAEEGVMLEFKNGEVAQYYQLWNLDAEPMLKSPTLGEVDLPRLGVAPNQHAFADLQLPDGRAGRLIEINFLPRVEVGDEWEEETEVDDDWRDKNYQPIPLQPVNLVFARERESLDATLLFIASSIFGVILMVLVISGGLVWHLVGSGLKPLSRLAQQVSGINESNLDARLTHEGRQSVEIAPIENQLNHLLERMQSAFEREKRFSSNAAHELRTPLAELRTLAEVARMVPDDADQVSQFFTDVGEISGQMEKVVTTLLELARSEAGLLRIDPEDIELSHYCDEVWRHAVNGSDAGKTLVKNIPSDLVINTDREKLGMILSNLFVNAASYSPDNAEIEIAALVRNRSVVLEVKNASCDLKPEDILHMKDRFWRKQKIRGESGHSGLGLTLVDALARILKLDVSLRLDQQQTFMVTISGLHPVVAPDTGAGHF